MSYLPHQQPATKVDIADLRQEMREMRIEFREDLRHIQSMLHARTRVHAAVSLGSAVTVAGLMFIAAQVV